jgi:hypothetical protein
MNHANPGERQLAGVSSLLDDNILNASFLNTALLNRVVCNAVALARDG